MTPDPFSVSERTTLEDALRTMADREIRHLPVVRGSEVVGMLSDRDFRSLGLSLVSEQRDVRARLQAQVQDIMTSGVISLSPEAELEEIIDLFVEEKLSAAPVIDEETNNLVGIVSYIDVLRAVRGELGE